MINKILKAKIIGEYGTQADFAQALGVNDCMISRVLRGRRSLPPEEQRKWAKALGCKPEDLDGTNAAFAR
jgi:transcriptional regulator with XRE-family HTH domain